MADTPSFLLIDLLRRRRELAPREVVRLLSELPSLIEGPPAMLRVIGPLLSGVRVSFPHQPADFLERALETRVTRWPPFELSLQAHYADTQASTVCAGATAEAGNATLTLALLIYELLGGSRRDSAGALCYAPLPELSECANELLCSAFHAEVADNPCDFWERWKREILDGEKIPEWKIPRRLLGAAQFGEVLDLTPKETGHYPIRLVSREEFRIGRSRSMADFPAHLSHEISVADSKKLSRVHLTGFAKAGEGLVFRDGNAQKPSTNGSTLEGQTITCEKGVRVETRGFFTLGNCYVLEAIPVLRDDLPKFVCSNYDEWEGTTFTARKPIPFIGAMFFRPPDRFPMVRDALWLFSAIGFWPAKSGKIEWSLEEATDCAWFMTNGGSFWLANGRLEEGEALVDGAPLGVGEIAPLASGQTVSLGPAQFTVAIA